MRGRAGHHGFSTAARAFTLAVVVAASLAQFAALSHEMTVRHIRCAEHGELTHVVSAHGDPAAAVLERGHALRPFAGDQADAHEHCGRALILTGGAVVSPPAVSGELAPPPPPPVPTTPRLARGREVALAAAPKTSPPRA
jgi:hypothetical protein